MSRTSAAEAALGIEAFHAALEALLHPNPELRRQIPRLAIPQFRAGRHCRLDSDGAFGVGGTAECGAG